MLPCHGGRRSAANAAHLAVCYWRPCYTCAAVWHLPANINSSVYALAFNVVAAWRAESRRRRALDDRRHRRAAMRHRLTGALPSGALWYAVVIAVRIVWPRVHHS